VSTAFCSLREGICRRRNHYNQKFCQAVTLGLAASGRFPTREIVPDVIAQVVGAVAASALLYVIASGAAGFHVSKGFALNGYGAHSPGQYSFVACFIMEVVMTMMFLFIIMGATHGKAPAGFAPLAIGLALVMIQWSVSPSPIR